MIGWLYRTIIGCFGCKHEWVVLQRVSVVRRDRAIPHKYEYILQCKTCGDLKSRSF